MRKDMRVIYDLAGEFGCEVLGITQTKHYKVTAKRPDGSIGHMTHPVSPSCHRAMLNQRSHWRRFALNQNK